MKKLEIIGGRKISGTVVISGSKNATLPILASTIMTNKKVLITNVPIVRDVETMIDLLRTIGSTVKLNEKEMIKPFVKEQKSGNIISYGLSSYGYDARVSNEFKIFTDVNSAVVDPKNFKSNSFVSRTSKECIIPPNSFALASTVEYFKIPRDVLVICLGKSTYARCGIIVNVTPLEPGWEGHVTLEFSNTTPLPAKIYANEGAAQFIFLQGNEKPQVTYSDRNGKYMKQRGVTFPKV